MRKQGFEEFLLSENRTLMAGCHGEKWTLNPGQVRQRAVYTQSHPYSHQFTHMHLNHYQSDHLWKQETEWFTGLNQVGVCYSIQEERFPSLSDSIDNFVDHYKKSSNKKYNLFYALFRFCCKGKSMWTLETQIFTDVNGFMLLGKDLRIERNRMMLINCTSLTDHQKVFVSQTGFVKQNAKEEGYQ